MKEQEKTITMKDVARLAGVGVGTVSRVVNGVRVKESTLLKVRAAIEELNYQPDEYARGLKTNRSNTIALIIPTIWHPFFSEFAYYVEKYLSPFQYKLFICNVDSDLSTEVEYLEMVKTNKVDGIIGIIYSDIDQYVSSNMPFVSIDRHFSEAIPYVTSDNYGGGQLAARELINRGAKHLAFIGSKNSYENETNLRRKGFYHVVEEENLPLYKCNLKEPILDLDGEIRAFLKENPAIDGIFAVTDFMALRTIRMMNELGKTAPKDYQIIGFDGLRPGVDQDYLLSTIRQPVEELAQCAVDSLLTLLRGDKPEARTVLPVTFISAGTTK